MFEENLALLTLERAWNDPFEFLKDVAKRHSHICVGALNGTNYDCLTMQKMFSTLRDSGQTQLLFEDLSSVSEIVTELNEMSVKITHEEAWRHINDFMLSDLSLSSLKALFGLSSEATESVDFTEACLCLGEFKQYGRELGYKVAIHTQYATLNGLLEALPNNSFDQTSGFIIFSFGSPSGGQFESQISIQSETRLESLPIEVDYLGKQPKYNFEAADIPFSFFSQVFYLIESGLCALTKKYGWGDDSAILIDRSKLKEILFAMLPELHEVSPGLASALDVYIRSTENTAGLILYYKADGNNDDTVSKAPNAGSLIYT